MMKNTLLLSIILLIVVFSSCNNNENSEEALASSNIQLATTPFLHGVASGDPLGKAVIIWTRVSVDTQSYATVKWSMAKDEAFKEVVKSDYTITDASKDFTIKVDVQGLESNTYYYYKFELGDYSSPIGRTKTTPVGDKEVSQVRLAVVSCSNYEAGYFNSYAKLAEKPDIDAVLHLGDYIYEYGPGTYGDTTIPRQHLPAKEIITLDDYRTRYAQYRTDKMLQRAHQVHPFITIWDDHEIMNNAYMDGGENHNEGEGDYSDRKSVAKQVYYEWMPIRESKTLYRKFEFGNITTLLMLDERLAGRTEPVDNKDNPNYGDEKRTMLGQEQFDWLVKNLKESEQAWKVLGNQVIFSDVNVAPIYGPEFPKNMDAWDGYPAEKQKIINAIKENNIKDIVFVSGDTHCSWAFEVPISPDNYNPRTSEGVVAVEFGTPGLTSANLDEYRSMEEVKAAEQKMHTANKHLKYLDTHSQGYFIFDMTFNLSQVDYYYIDKINTESETEIKGKSIILRKGRSQLVMGK
jgi:alkaline phosphatase D